MAAGGKRFRPMLALLAAQLGDARAPEVIRAAVVCELTHLATLYHDDVMDEAAVRRGAPSANSRWTNSIAILTGDLLFARASDLLADLGPEAVRIQAQHVRAAGHRADPRDRRPPAGRRPGGPLPRACWPTRPARWSPPRPGSARASPASTSRWSSALTAFGEEVGVAFQLSDDLLDIVSEGGASGKSPGTDLREGIATLPALFVLAGDDPADARLRELVVRPRHRRRRPRRGAGAAAGLRRPGPRERGARRVRRPRPRPAGRRARGRRPRRAVGAVRLRGHPHQLEAHPGRMRTLAGLIAVALLVPACTGAGPSADPPLPAPAAPAAPPAAPPGVPALDVDRRRRRAGPRLGRRPGGRRHAAGRRAGRRVHRGAARRQRAGGRGRLRRPVRPRGDRTHGAGARPRLRGEPPPLQLPGRHGRRRRSPSSPGRWRPTGARPPASPTRWSGGMPLNERSGRHGGCRLRFAPDGACSSARATTAGGTVRRTPVAGRQGAARRRGHRRA